MSLTEITSKDIISSTVMMTPEKARYLLTKNNINRKLRPHWVSELAGAIRNGEWKLTHQGIAISKSGRLLDGQHRLMAILSSGIPVPIIVAENCDDEMFAFVDKGMKRTLGDSLGIKKGVAETIKYLMYLANRRTERPGLAMEYYLSEFGKAAEFLVSAQGTTRRVASSSAIKSAAVLIMVDTGCYERIATNYSNFVLSKYEAMTPSLLAFERQISTGKVNTRNNWDVFARAYKSLSAFDDSQTILKIGPKELEDTTKKAREIIARTVKLANITND